MFCFWRGWLIVFEETFLKSLFLSSELQNQSGKLRISISILKSFRFYSSKQIR
jgi:hypothetical protein